MTNPISATNDYINAAELAALEGQKIRVSKGLPDKGIRKHMTGRIVAVTFHKDYGFKCVFDLSNGKRFSMGAASIARFRGIDISLNTGNPLERVVLTKVG